MGKFGTSGRAGRSDEQLVAALAQHEVEALETLYERYKSVAFSLAYRILGERSAAEDALQEAFLSLWRRAGSYQPGRGKVRSWLMAIVHHRSVDALRRSATPTSELAFEELPEYESDSPAVLEQVWTGDRAAIVRTALEQLPADQKKSIELAYFSGYTHVEIARLMGVPLGTVKGRLRIGLQKLKAMLDVRLAEASPS